MRTRRAVPRGNPLSLSLRENGTMCPFRIVSPRFEVKFAQIWGQSLWRGQAWSCWAFLCFVGISLSWVLEPRVRNFLDFDPKTMLKAEGCSSFYKASFRSMIPRFESSCQSEGGLEQEVILSGAQTWKQSIDEPWTCCWWKQGRLSPPPDLQRTRPTAVSWSLNSWGFMASSPIQSRRKARIAQKAWQNSMYQSPWLSLCILIPQIKAQIKHIKNFSIKNFSMGPLRRPPPKFFMFGLFPVFWRERSPKHKEFTGSGVL